jgi:lysophospholipase L1-like esterase
MARRLLRKSLLVTLWLAFIGSLVELTGFVYFTLEVSKPAGGYGYPREMFVPLDKVEYGYRPNFRGTFEGVAYFNIPIAINATGFRDVPFAPKRPGTLRIAVLGDSVVFGAGVAAQDRFTDLLRGFTPPGGRPTELLNLGVNSYAFVHYLGQVERNFEGLHPDAVVLGFTLNDYQPFDSAWPRRVVRAAEPPGPHPTLERRVSRLLGNSYAGRFLTDLRDKLMLAAMGLDEREAYHTKWMRRSVEQWSQPDVQARMQQELVQMQARLAERRLPVIYLLFPELNDVRHPGTFGLARKTILGMLTELRIPVCDPYPAFAGAPDPGALFLVNDSVHYTPAGHRILADTLAACLRDAGWGAGGKPRP